MSTNIDIDGRCQVTSFQALMAALQHPAITGDVETVCSLLQTCRSWRTVLQQCKAGNLTIFMPPHTATASSVQCTQQVARFAGWLPQHAGLIGGLCLHEAPGVPADRAAFCDTAEQLLVLSLKEAAASGRPSAASTPGCASTSTLQLSMLNSSVIRSPALLHALPAAAVTLLVLLHSGSWQTGLDYNTTGFTRGLAQLTALRDLKLHGAAAGNACLAAVGQLTLLTKASLDVSALPADSCNLQLLPQQLQQLDLEANNRSLDAGVVDLGHLTALQQLQLTLWCNPAAGSALPAALTALTVICLMEEPDVQHLCIPQLSQLQQLHAVDSLQQPEQLQQLAAMPQLRHLVVSYETCWPALSVAPSWRHLSALRGIVMRNNELSLDEEESMALLQHLAAASSLHWLDFDAQDVLHPAACVCEYIANLPQLQHLDLASEHPATRAEALTLTKLTSLTALRLSGAAGVDDVAAVALAARLTKLRSLRLAGCGLRTAAALPVIATLTGLTELQLSSHPFSYHGQPLLPEPQQLTKEDLLLLAPLTQLKQLSCCGFVQQEAFMELWDDKNSTWRVQQ